MAKLPTVTSPLPRDLQQFVQRVREALDSGGPDAVVTARQLIAAGVVGSSTSGGITPIGGTIETPRAPSGLTASGALASIIVSWNGPQYKGHAYTEIWAHTSDVIGDAVLVGMTAGNNFAHNLGNAAVRYYWVRNVNQNGVVSAFNATNGVQGSTGQDPAYLLTLLTDEITSSQLASSLGTRIDLIDGADTVVGSVNERVKIERLARQSSDSTINSAISSEESARQSADAATTSQVNNAISQTQNNAAAVISEQTTRADADAATASQLNGVVSEAQNNRAAISSEIITRATATSAVASQLVGMEATVNNNTSALAAESTVRADDDSANAAQSTVIVSAVNTAQAAISTEATTRAANDTATASQITTLQSSVSGNTTSISTQQTAVNGLEAQYTVKIDNNGHVSGFGLASELVDGNISSDFMVAADRFSVVDPSAVAWYDLIKITDYGNSKRAVFGSLAFTQSFPPNSEVKIMGHPDGHNGNFSVHGTGSLGGIYFIVAAYSASQPLNTVTTSEASSADLRATKTGTPPFVIATGSTQINGVTVPAGTYIDSAMIADATIKQAQIGTLNADVINSGLLNTVDFYGNTIAGASIYLGGTVTYATDSSNNNIGITSIATPKVAMTSTGAVFAVDAFTIDNPGGTNVEPFSITNDVVEIDTALISDGTITMAKIEDTIKSTNYDGTNNTGWKLDQDGTLDLNSASITAGTLQSTDGNFVIDLTNGTITISS